MTRTRIAIDAGKIQIPLADILEALDDAARLELIDSLACEDAVIKHVADQILDGFTENGSHGGIVYGASAVKPSTPLSTAQREVARRSSEVAAREIERLEQALVRETAAAREEGRWAAIHKLDALGQHNAARLLSGSKEGDSK